MESRLSRAARKELVEAVGIRYRDGAHAEKARILDEFVALTGYHRKHAIRLLNAGSNPVTRKRTHQRVYDEAVRQAVIVLWEASDRVCGKRLKPLLPILISALERHGHIAMDVGVKERVLAASAATLDRLLADTRASIRGSTRRTKRAIPVVRQAVAVRTFGDWSNPIPGFMEIDLVAHSGGNPSGSFLNTLTLTDIASGWTECQCLLFRDGVLVVEVLSQLGTRMPFPLLGIDTDNGSEFLNKIVIGYCSDHGIEFTRSRPWHKNDQAWVEQKNGSVVRRLVGYGRFEGSAAAQILNRLYDASRLFVNFFQPSSRLLSKTRNGARVTKHYDVPATPCMRLLASDVIPEAVKEHLRAVAENLDPLSLLDEIRSCQRTLASVAAGKTPHLLQSRQADLDGFLKSLATAWKAGEVRPTHIPQPRRERDWRTRKDDFADVWPKVNGWLLAQPDRTAREIFQRLQAEYPGVFHDHQLRTLQRRVKEWRNIMARRLVFGKDRMNLRAGPETVMA